MNLKALVITVFLSALPAYSLCETIPLSTPDKEKFRFFINADPQMGAKDTEIGTLLILNDLLEDFAHEVNRKHEKEQVDFVVYNGDLVWDPYEDAFANFTRLVSIQKPPVVLVHGNHDGFYPDKKFLQAQQKLSGYQKLNYSFDYGKWHFVVIAAQEMYIGNERRQEQLDWIKNELAENKDKQVMLFMHYHLMPVGLSQMESYTYWPTTYKNKIIDIITEHGNVKYVFNGHVHTGVKASVKSSLEFKGTKFVNGPTPVFARPFGEEYKGFHEDGRYKHRGFYMEVKVDGDEIEMIGHKIKNDYSHRYPQSFKKFKPEMDIRAFTPEAILKYNPKLINGDFAEGFEGWQKSYRYVRDEQPMFNNEVIEGSNKLSQVAGYGSWNLDEYMESWQTLHFDINQPNHLSYKFETPIVDKRGAGGYIRIFSYNKAGKPMFMLLFHWGHEEKRVRYMYRAWATNTTGEKLNAFWLNREIRRNNLMSFKLPIKEGEKQKIEIDLNAVFKHLKQQKKNKVDLQQISHIGLAHGVWTRITYKGVPITSQLNVDDVALNHLELSAGTASITLNGDVLRFTEKEDEVPYAEYLRNKILNDRKQKSK